MCGNRSLWPQQLSVMPAPVSAPVIFHPAAVEGERDVCVFVWKAHLAERETYNPTPPPTDLHLPPPPHLLFLRPPSHLLPFPCLLPRRPRGRDGSVSGAGDVTLGNLRFTSSEECTGGTISLCLQCMQTLVFACERWSSFCIQVRYCIQLVVVSFYHLLCRQIYVISML